MTTATVTGTDMIRWFHEVGLDDVATVGGKNASLGEMYRELTPQVFASRMASRPP